MSTLTQELEWRLRFCRTNRGLTLDQVAAETGISKSTLSRIERGATKVSLNADTGNPLLHWCSKYLNGVTPDGDAMPAIEKLLAQDTTLTPHRRTALFDLLNHAYATFAAH